jgi:serine/threonine protein kinase
VQRVESWEELARRALELGEALAAVHGMGRVHGDVKETNMCAAAGGALKLTDWESGVAAGERPRMHTEGYRAPETLLEEGRWFCAKSDVYSAGIVLSKWVKRLHKRRADEAARGKWLQIAARMTAEKVEERMDAAELVRELVGATEETKPVASE